MRICPIESPPHGACRKAGFSYEILMLGLSFWALPTLKSGVLRLDDNHHRPIPLAPKWASTKRGISPLKSERKWNLLLVIVISFNVAMNNSH